LRQALGQLLSNACKFSLRGGKVNIRVRTDWARNAAQGSVVLSIEDKGCGMSAEQLEQALQPFRQVEEGLNRRFQGLGLGLSIAASLVRLHGGVLGVDSKLGQGTTVLVRLPCAPLRAMASDTAPVAKAAVAA